MAQEPGSRRSPSPDSSGRDTPTPRQWRNQLGVEEPHSKDKQYRKFASGVERALSLFDTALQEWADYISFLSRLLKALQARPAHIHTVPTKVLVAKRLSQCLNPSLPSGVHQKALEVYNHVFSIIGPDGLSLDLPLYLPGLATVLSFASLTVRGPYLDLLEKHLVQVQPRAMRPAMRSIILAMLPGLEDETSEDFDRTFRLLEQFKANIRPPSTKEITPIHSTGDEFFWQCFFLATITSPGRRPGALAYLVRNLPKLGHSINESTSTKVNAAKESELAELSKLVASPEPGLLVRCFAAGMTDEQLLIQRGFLDLLVTHLPLHSKVLQSTVKPDDMELLLRASVSVVTRREMSLNRRLWAWFLGPEPADKDQEQPPESPNAESDQHHNYLASKTNYFEEYGLHPLIQALLSTINSASSESTAAERARPYRICLSLMDRWEIGGLVVPEIFLPVITSVKQFKDTTSSKAEFAEVLRSASVFFDGVESGLIYGEMVDLMAQAIGPGSAKCAERAEKLSLVRFIITHFNVREEEMVTIHAPLMALSILSTLEETKDRGGLSSTMTQDEYISLTTDALDISLILVDLIPERAFPVSVGREGSAKTADSSNLTSLPNIDILKKVRNFYVADQGNLEMASSPFPPRDVGDLLVQKASNLACESLSLTIPTGQGSIRSRLLALVLLKVPKEYHMDTDRLLSAMQARLSKLALPFTTFKSILALSTQLYSEDRVSALYLSNLAEPLTRHAWEYLSLSEPKYHVETVGCLWQLQSALTTSNRDIEACIAGLMVKGDTGGAYASRPADPGRTFSILWSHTLQNHASQSDRRLPKTPMGELKSPFRLSGTDHYEAMLTRPLFLMLDSLLDERTQLFMAVKTWLGNMIGIDKLFLVFVTKLTQLKFLRVLPSQGHAPLSSQSVKFSDEDDLELALYYIRTLTNVFRWAPEAFWAVLAKKTIEEPDVHVVEMTGKETDLSLQEFFLHICMRCLAGNIFPSDVDVQSRVAQLHRGALSLLHQILSNPYAEPLASLNLDGVLVDRLSQSLGSPDPYTQVLLLDVTFDSLKLKFVSSQANPPPTPTVEKQAVGYASGNARLSATSLDQVPEIPQPPPTLLQCIQAGLSSPNSRPVLDSWVTFLAECLPLYSTTIFQVLIPLVETLCTQIGETFEALEQTFVLNGKTRSGTNGPETTLISLINALEQVLSKAHDWLLAEEARAQVVKSPDQPQGLFGNMMSGVFNSEAPQSRSATANDRLTVHLAFQDVVRICFKIWSWGSGSDPQSLDVDSAFSFNYTSLRMRNRARRLLEHLFAAEALECLETAVDIWRASLSHPDTTKRAAVFNLLPALDGSRPRYTIPAIFNAIYSRSNPSALDPSRKSTLTISLQDSDLVVFLVDYARSLEDDAMDEIWQDCMTFLKDLLGNPFPHRQTIPSLLEFAAILGEKVDNTNFGEQRKMRRELGDMFLRLLTALFTTRPSSFAESPADKPTSSPETALTSRNPTERADDVVGILSRIVPILPKILVEQDRVLTAASAISSNIIGPAIRSKHFPDTISKSTLTLVHELTRLPSNQKNWKKDISDAFNDTRFFGSPVDLIRSDWLPLLKQWTLTDKERMVEILSRITPPTTAGIVFGVGATSARLEADRKTQLNLRRIATLILASPEDSYAADLPSILEKLVELLAATSTSSPSSTTRAEIYMVIRALVLRISHVHLSPLWPVVNSELHGAISSVVAPDNSAASDAFNNISILQACKLLDLLIAVGLDDFQLHEWLFITDTLDAIYRTPSYQPVALVDEVSEELGNAIAFSDLNIQTQSTVQAESLAHTRGRRRLILGPGGINDELTVDRKSELVAKILRPFFGQLSILACEATYAMGTVDEEECISSLLKDLFDEKSVVRAL